MCAAMRSGDGLSARCNRMSFLTEIPGVLDSSPLVRTTSATTVATARSGIRARWGRIVLTVDPVKSMLHLRRRPPPLFHHGHRCLRPRFLLPHIRLRIPPDWRPVHLLRCLRCQTRLSPALRANPIASQSAWTCARVQATAGRQTCASSLNASFAPSHTAEAMLIETVLVV